MAVNVSPSLHQEDEGDLWMSFRPKFSHKKHKKPIHLSSSSTFHVSFFSGNCSRKNVRGSTTKIVLLKKALQVTSLRNPVKENGSTRKLVLQLIFSYHCRLRKSWIFLCTHQQRSESSREWQQKRLIWVLTTFGYYFVGIGFKTTTWPCMSTGLLQDA